VLLYVRTCANIILMRAINFYRFDNDKCPVEEYLDTLSNKQVEKVFFVLQLVESLDIVPRKFFVKLESTDDIWEVRVQFANNIFRFLGFFDGAELIILNHAFTKKTQKTPKKEIKIAEQRKKDYFSRRSIR
jgi:phage-related protein